MLDPRATPADGGHNSQVIDGETRLFTIAADGSQALASITARDGLEVTGHGLAGKTPEQVATARPRKEQQP